MAFVSNIRRFVGELITYKEDDVLRVLFDLTRFR